MGFKLKLEPLAKRDIQNEVKFYNIKKSGLGKKISYLTKSIF